MSSCNKQAIHTSGFDADITALTIQLDEIRLFIEGDKGKYAANQPPDRNIVCAAFEEELRRYEVFITDQRLAHSMGAAVHVDGEIILESTIEETQCQEDRLLALQISNDEPGYEDPPASGSIIDSSQVQNWLKTATHSQHAGSVVDFAIDDSDDGTEAGPSKTFAERQADVLEKLSQRLQCVVCREKVFSNLTVSLPCGDRYCIECLKGYFIRATKDEMLFPVRCHKKPIPLNLIAAHLSVDELAAFERASIEFSTVDRTYCSNRACGEFIPPEQIQSATHRASCTFCSTSTCGLCNRSYHGGLDCPDDPELRQTRDLAGELGWQTCFSCGSIVVLRSGCNHMTCCCKAEFCYECGTQWKQCRCEHADAGRILERAEEIVERDAPIGIPQRERRERVQQVRAELELNHECEHPGKFQRIYECGRRGFRCEMCDVRHWKYMLQCRHCFINVCEDCRRWRV
ncbi:hypothetical protein C7974DRAFT_364271 [Boeremia exigua]|uniref:uncharacterized protein n=1 Tax=Boeremia exigua TaxID=749465 RepID=UPI001E8C9FDB|nr:uncharacterized protein C7974DRAFT_364271 [Boeremia exigua]KAH6620583.1 hypothetical protein C7974DRAFT_364271 [Boeremia exigua]